MHSSHTLSRVLCGGGESGICKMLFNAFGYTLTEGGGGHPMVSQGVSREHSALTDPVQRAQARPKD